MRRGLPAHRKVLGVASAKEVGPSQHLSKAMARSELCLKKANLLRV